MKKSEQQESLSLLKMKNIIYSFVILFVPLLVGCSNPPKKVNTCKEQKNDTIIAIQKMLIGKWMSTDDSSIINIGYDTVCGGFTSSALCKYKIEIEEPHGKIKQGQYWFGFALHRCKENDSSGFNDYFGSISIDSTSMYFYAFEEEHDTALKSCETEAFIKLR